VEVGGGFFSGITVSDKNSRYCMKKTTKARYTLATKSSVAKTGDKSATESTVDFVADLSPVCRKSTVARELSVVSHQKSKICNRLTLW